MPESENLKVEDLSKSVKQAHHSEQATGQEMHCREILFTPRCSPRARKLPGSGRLFCTTYTVAELRGVKLAQFLDFGLCRRYMRSTECPSSFLCDSKFISCTQIWCWIFVYLFAWLIELYLLCMSVIVTLPYLDKT